MSHTSTVSSSSRRLLGRTVALGISALVAVLVSPASTSSATPPGCGAGRPTIVLVHGAFAAPSSWDRVVAGLQKDGCDTVTPTLGLHDVAGDVAVVRSALDGIAGTKILVGHSYGGVVVSNASAGRTDVVGLVYTAAFVPDEGETINDLGAGYAPPAFLAPPFPPGHFVFDGSGRAVIDPAHFRADFAQDLNPQLAGALAASQIPTDLGILLEPSGPVGWRSIPSWYAVSAADRIIDPELQRAVAARAHSTVVTFDDASHAGGFTHYATRFVKLVEQAARTH